jgi:hypothetical protein
VTRKGENGLENFDFLAPSTERFSFFESVTILLVPIGIS